MADESYITLYGGMRDRFGDNGIVSVIIGHVIENVCCIDLWLMSCRVLKRDMESAMMDALAGRCQERGLREIRGYYYPTEKNHMVENFYELQGFDKIGEDKDGSTEWRYRLFDSYTKKNKFIIVEE